jgi:hypothetical protein
MPPTYVAQFILEEVRGTVLRDQKKSRSPLAIWYWLRKALSQSTCPALDAVLQLLRKWALETDLGYNHIQAVGFGAGWSPSLSIRCHIFA